MLTDEITARITALGEPLHGDQDLLRHRNDVIRDLVARGARTVALEIDCLAARRVDAYVHGAADDLDEVMRTGFSHDWGAYDGNRELVQWLREHNSGAEPVSFVGFDGPLEITHAASPREALTTLRDELGLDVEDLDTLLGDDGLWTEPQAMFDPARSVGRTPQAHELRLLADDLGEAVDTRAPELQNPQLCALMARTATGLLRYHAAMADPSPDRMGKLLAVRAGMMARNLLALKGPVVAHAHVAHLKPARSQMQMWTGPVRWWSAGALVAPHRAYEFVELAQTTG